MLHSLAAALAFATAGLAAYLLAGDPAALVPTDAETFLVRSHEPGLAPEQRLALLRAGHALDPRDTTIALELGLEQERSGNLAAAEQVLTVAARYDRQYVPAWTLANFYFRRNRPEAFWRWAAVAAARNPGDFRPLLQLADWWEPDAARLADRLGNQSALLRAELDLLLGEHRFGAARQIGERLAAFRDPNDQARLAALADRLRAEPATQRPHESAPHVPHTAPTDQPPRSSSGE